MQNIVTSEMCSGLKNLVDVVFFPSKTVLVCTNPISSRFRVDIYERDSKQLVDAGSLNDGENTAVKTFGNHGDITPLQHISFFRLPNTCCVSLSSSIFSERMVSAHWDGNTWGLILAHEYLLTPSLALAQYLVTS